MALNPLVGSGNISPFISWSVSKADAPQSGRGLDGSSVHLQG